VRLSKRLRRVASSAAVSLLAAACATAIVSSTHQEGQSVAGPTIQLGQGHFSKTNKAFRYWDKEPAIPPVCARCHAADGLATFLRDGKNPASPHVAGYGFACTNCHVDAQTFVVRDAARVTFASGASVDTGDRASNLCMQCHQGRESTVSVNKAIAGMDADKPEPKLNFVHVHYLQAGATMFGTEAAIGYEYASKTYAGRSRHPLNTCTSCHDPHGLRVKAEGCTNCHASVKDKDDLPRIRVSKGDLDGNGREDGLGQEIASLTTQLYAVIQNYARTVSGVPIAFSPEAFPYWYADRNGNGQVDPDELRPDNKYPAYTPRLLQAVYNYTFAIRDPGAAYHNGAYTAQLLHDSLQSLSQRVPVNMQGKARP
jgi:hypothetical protein